MYPKPSHTDAYNRERNAELVGVLTAISIVSKRLAGRLAALEQKTNPEKGRKTYGKQDSN